MSQASMALHAHRLLLPLPMVTNVNNNGELISLPEVTTNKIYMYYGTIRELYTNEKSK